MAGPQRVGESYSMTKTWIQAGLAVLASVSGIANATPSVEGEVMVIARDDFKGDLSQWQVEQQPGGTVTVKDGALVIADKAGCTVWLRQPLQAPVRISYVATVVGGERVSDLNCFWMANDPRSPGDLFKSGHGRDGMFASYDTLKTYYVGCGGNGNTTTRFRRYDGSGARPLLPEHDRKEPEALLESGRPYRIEITVTADGRTTWARDGKVWLSTDDPAPLRSGWFGFRTVWSRIEIRDFKAVRL
jgi:hypothetical protein